MLILHQSNRVENLFGQLALLTETPLAEVLMPEIIVVQSQGMARWLSLELARSQGVCANFDFPFPAAFIWRLLEQAYPLRGPSLYEPEIMRW
ncbi:MAG: exodeoxyribonuclease V subunit gamma [Proteobacteria bacterium]|nr:exodeoxyribonuclease V subunit gamma [Pseudomonadota bacterium]